MRPGGTTPVGRPLVASLFVASALLSVVSWYTTQRGMALYLSPWLSVLASLGIQSALVLVAWLVGLTRSRRALLVAVYVITSVVSVAFSYVSLHTWFSSRQRPAVVRRQLYDALVDAAGRSQVLLAAAVAEGQRHVVALDQMSATERAHGYVSRSGDMDPWLATVRGSVADEAGGLGTPYPEGAGSGLRHAAFERHARIARQTVARLERARETFAELGASLGPLQPADAQLRAFRGVFDAVPWSEVRDTLHSGPLALPEVPTYSAFVDHTASSQEDLLIAFHELVSAPTARHATALALATFIDVVIFLVAWTSGPFFFGSPEQRWLAAGAALDGKDTLAFARELVSRLGPGPGGAACVEASTLSPGEQQVCMVMATNGLAAVMDEGERSLYLVDPRLHERLVETLAERPLALRAAVPAGS